VRSRITKHGGETIDAPSEWAKYFSESSQRERDRENAVMIKPTLKGEKYGGIDI
jgi:hypothetical protein